MTLKEFNQIFISLNKLFFSIVFIYDQEAVSITKTHFEITQYTFYIYKLYLQTNVYRLLVIPYQSREILGYIYFLSRGELGGGVVPLSISSNP